MQKGPSSFPHLSKSYSISIYSVRSGTEPESIYKVANETSRDPGALKSAEVRGMHFPMHLLFTAQEKEESERVVFVGPFQAGQQTCLFGMLPTIKKNEFFQLGNVPHQRPPRACGNSSGLWEQKCYIAYR